MTEPNRERNVDFTNPQRTETKARGYRGRIEYFGSGEYPGVRFKTWKFKDIDASEKDGALIEIDPGRRTPVQLVVAEKVFSEVPLTGKLVFLHIDQEENISAYLFDSEEDKDKSFLFEVGKGEIMCWFALKDQPNFAEVLEYEEPGFTESDFINIEFGEKEVAGRKIPNGFWEAMKKLETEGLESLTNIVINLGEL